MKIPGQNRIILALSLLFLPLKSSHAGSNEAIVAWGMEWGWQTAINVPGDYNGDGTYDLAAYDPIGGYWYILSLKDQTSNTSAVINQKQCNALGTEVLPLSRIEGVLPEHPVAPGSVAIHQRDAYTGESYWTLIDNGSNKLWTVWIHEAPKNSSNFVSLALFGEIDYESGKWYVDLSPFEYVEEVTPGSGEFIIKRWGGQVGKFEMYADYIPEMNQKAPRIISWKNQWGWNGAKPVSGDYDGDGQHDLAVVDPVSGKWYIKSLAK